MRAFLTALLPLLVFCIAGCGLRTASVHGTVRYQGEPVANGTIIFLASNNQAYPARIGADGSYRVAALPQGSIKVAVQLEEPRPAPRAAPDMTKGNSVPDKGMQTDDQVKERSQRARTTAPTFLLPRKYAEPATSGLAFELDTNDKEYSVDLE